MNKLAGVMTYDESLKLYECEKAKLRQLPLSDKEYEEAVKKLADKLMI